MSMDYDPNDIKENDLKRQIENIDRSLINLQQLEQSIILD